MRVERLKLLISQKSRKLRCYVRSGLKPGFHIVVSVVRKKFIGQIEFILSRTSSICRYLVLSICTGGFHKVVSVL